MTERPALFLSEAESWHNCINVTVGEILKERGINPTSRRIARVIARAKQLERSEDHHVLHRDWEFIQHLAAKRFYRS